MSRETEKPPYTLMVLMNIEGEACGVGGEALLSPNGNCQKLSWETSGGSTQKLN